MADISRLRTLIKLLFFLVASCAGPEAAPAPIAADEVWYRFELADAGRPLVRIHVECAGDADGATELAVEKPGGGVEAPGKDLELVLASAGGRPLETERLETWRWRVRHRPGARIHAVFALEPTSHRADADPRVHYQPILEPRLLHVLGSNALPAPEHLDPTTPRVVHLEWRGFSEAGWNTVSSHGMGTDPFEVRTPLDGFRHAVFLAGDLAFLERQVHGAELCIAVHGRDWATPLENFAELCATIVSVEREFFGELEWPFYLISLIPVGKKEPGVVSMGGTGLTNSFALFLLPGAHLGAAETEGMTIPWLLAHEMFHTWNGQAVALREPERLGYWFSEGFTDFYARRLLRRSGLMSLEQYVDSWNRRFAEYASNPERNAPATRIEEAFWTVRDVGSLPYQRGDLVALFVDHAIRERSGGAASLDDLLRALVACSRDGKRELTVDELLGTIAEFAGKDAADTVRRAVVDGADVVLPLNVGHPDLVLSQVEIPRFDVGFDHERTVAEGTVAGVRPGSAAEAAGLRDGMKALGWSVHFGSIETPIAVTVRDGDTDRTISYLPVGEAVPGYRFTPKQP